MEKCQKKDRLYNPKTKRCYKSCEQKNKVTHPITQKCRQHCKGDKIRRIEDFRCIKKTLKSKQENRYITKKASPNKNNRNASSVKRQQEEREKQVAQKQVAQEDLIPPKIQKELKVNLKMFDKWMSKGVQKGNIRTIDYDSSDRITDIILIYLHKKYKYNCPVYPIKTYSSDELELKPYYKNLKKAFEKENITFDIFKKQTLEHQKIQYIDWNVVKFLKNIQLCLETGEKLMIIPLRLPGHLNMLFIKVETREIIRFEPHGSKYRGDDTGGEESRTNKFLETLTNQINTFFELEGNRAFKYISQSNTCPRMSSENIELYQQFNSTEYDYIGFQADDYNGEYFSKGKVIRGKKNRREKGGFCLLWSWFFAECVAANPDIPINEIYKEADKALREEPLKIATIIRGYFLSVNDELKKMKEKYNSITGKYVKKNIYNGDTFLIDYLLESKKKLQKKPRKTFVGGVNNKPKFILPEANPDAKPVTA